MQARAAESLAVRTHAGVAGAAGTGPLRRLVNLPGEGVAELGVCPLDDMPPPTSRGWQPPKRWTRLVHDHSRGRLRASRRTAGSSTNSARPARTGSQRGGASTGPTCRSGWLACAGEPAAVTTLVAPGVRAGGLRSAAPVREPARGLPVHLLGSHCPDRHPCLSRRGRRACPGGSSQGYSLAVVRRQGRRLIGSCAVWTQSAAHARGALGFVVHPQVWGQGFATEVTPLLLRLGF